MEFGVNTFPERQKYMCSFGPVGIFVVRRKLKTINASYIIHRNERRIRLQFDPDKVLNAILRNFSGARWSKTIRAWHIPYSKSLYIDLKKLLPADCALVEMKVGATKEMSQQVIVRSVQSVTPAVIVKPAVKMHTALQISEANKMAMNRFTEMLGLKAYSESTIRTYKNEFGALLQILGKHNACDLNAEHVRRYILYCINYLQLSENTIHSRLNALKFYFEQVLKKEKIFVEIPRPKKPFILPKVLGEQEIGRLFKALQNKKHKAILFTAYSAGLRVSEVVSLQIKHIDSDRMQIFIENAKGKKDRYVMLSPVLLDILRNYLKSSKPRPRKYLFEGIEPGEPLSSRTAQQVFIEAKNKAGILKSLSFHSLRHSFATHLLENGVDIKYIRDLLGHFSIHTTTRYLHVKRESLVNIRSPLDEIYRTGNMEF